LPKFFAERCHILQASFQILFYFDPEIPIKTGLLFLIFLSVNLLQNALECKFKAD